MKKILSLVLAALLMLCTLSFTVSAEDGAVVYLSFAGNNANDGLTPETPKKSWGGLADVGAVSLLANGGTMVVVGKAYIGASYDLPAFSAPLTITGAYNGVDYKNPEPVDSPTSGVFKMKGSAVFTINSDVIFDDIILFQENEQNTIKVPAGVTLTVTDSVLLMTKTGNDYHFKLVVEEGGKAILSKAAQETFEIENNGTVETYGGAAAAAGVEIKMTLNQKQYIQNGETVAMDVAPQVVNGRTMLPARAIAEALGAIVGWDGDLSAATFTNDTTVIKIIIGSDVAIVNDEEVKLDAAAFIEDSRAFLPLRFICETLGATVDWDTATSTATITK